MKKFALFFILLSSRCYALDFNDLCSAFDNEPSIHEDLKECLSDLLYLRQQYLTTSEMNEVNELTALIGDELVNIGSLITDSDTDYYGYAEIILRIAKSDVAFTQTQAVIHDTDNAPAIKEMVLQQLRARYKQFAQSRQKQLETYAEAKKAEIKSALLQPLMKRKKLIESLLLECDGNSGIHTQEQCATAREFLAQIDRSIETANPRTEILLNNFKI